MSNRQQRRYGKYTAGPKVRVSGPQLERIVSDDPADHVKPGEHLWIGIVTFHLAHPETWTTEEQHFDTENLLSVSGPGCYICEQVWTPIIAAFPCPGESP